MSSIVLMSFRQTGGDAAALGISRGCQRRNTGALDCLRQVSDRPELVNVEAMRAAPFDYPHGLIAALHAGGGTNRRAVGSIGRCLTACNALLLDERRNVADLAVSLRAAHELGLKGFDETLHDPVTPATR